MRAVIVGPGAIGCLFAARLAEAGCAVVLFDRRPERAARLSCAGIRLHDAAGTRTVRVDADVNPRRFAEADLVLVCVKAFDTGAVADLLASVPHLAATVVSLQNGLDNLACLSTRIDPERLVCASTGQGATLLAEGWVRDAGRGISRCAPAVPGDMREAQRTADGFNAAGLEAVAVPDAAELIWSKLAINAGINPVTALHGVRNGALLERRDLLEIAVASAREVQATASAAGVRLSDDDAARAIVSTAENTRDNLSSMLQDLRRGRRTEVDAINGAVVREAAAHGVAAPVNAMLLERVRALEAGR